MISHNLNACLNKNQNGNGERNGYMNYVHFTVWSKLKFLSECETFTLIDKIEKNQNQNHNQNHYQNQKYNFMLEIFKNNINDIITYLIYDKVKKILIENLNFNKIN